MLERAAAAEGRRIWRGCFSWLVDFGSGGAEAPDNDESLRLTLLSRGDSPHHSLKAEFKLLMRSFEIFTSVSAAAGPAAEFHQHQQLLLLLLQDLSLVTCLRSWFAPQLFTVEPETHLRAGH